MPVATRVRLTERAAARDVARALGPEILTMPASKGGARLTHAERTLFDRELLDASRTFVGLALIGVRAAMNKGAEPVAPTRERPRPGRPARLRLREALRVLVGSVERQMDHVRAGSGRSKRAIAARLLLLYEFDVAGPLWSRSARNPPRGAARLRWIAERIRELTEEDVGQYAERRAKRHIRPHP